MAKKSDAPSFWAGLLQADVYKRSQGRLARRLTFIGIAVLVLSGAWTLNQALLNYDTPVRVGVPALIAAVGLWIGFRAINFPRFADFLISVEAEMDKVTWSSRAELIRATIVVVVMMAVLSTVLFAFDVFWVTLFTKIGVLK